MINFLQWTKVAPMTTRRLGVAVAVLGGYLYAIGGSDGSTPLNTVERYDPRQVNIFSNCTNNSFLKLNTNFRTNGLLYRPCPREESILAVQFLTISSMLLAEEMIVWN